MHGRGELYLLHGGVVCYLADVHCSHGISKPIVDRDFFYHQTELSLARGRKTVFVGLDPRAGHRCLKCTGQQGLRVRLKGDLMKHLVHGCVFSCGPGCGAWWMTVVDGLFQA